jgi:cobalt-zinc-cadmium resistance protein CzcA
MLDAVIRWSLRHRFLVLLITAGLVAVGVMSLHALPIDAFPDTTPAQVQVNTVAPALAPEEVERQLTVPVEQALAGLPGLDQLRSISKFGLSQVVVNFRDGTDVYFARQLVAERLSTVELPPGIARPRMGPVTTGLGEVFHYAVTGHGKSLAELRTIQDWVIKPALRTVPGVAEINSWGGLERQYQVRIDPLRLLKHGVTFQQVIDALQANNLSVGGGDLARAGEVYLVHGVALSRSLDDLRGIVVAAVHGAPVRVGDIADVQLGHEIRRGAATADGEGEVVLGLGFMLMGENSHDVTHRLRQKLAEVRRSLPSGVEVKILYDRTELVDHVIDTVRSNLFEGGLLVIAVLFLFLGNLRAGLIVALAIPLSLLTAFSGMLRFAIAGSLLSLGAIDFGLVVDSSVVLVENVVRHLAHGDAVGRDKRDVIAEGAVEVRKPTLFGELIIIIVYLPILTLEGVEGKLFRPMALTVVFALLGSLIFSLTLMPVLCSLLLPRKMREREPWVIRAASWVYRPLLGVALNQRLAVLGLAVAALVTGLIIYRGLGSEFIPQLSEGAFAGNAVRLAGTDLHESVRLNTAMEQKLLAAFPDEIAHVWDRLGVAEVATDPMGVELTDIFIALKPREQWSDKAPTKTQAELLKLIKQELEGIPGQKLAFSQPIKQRLDEMTTGARADLAVKVYGDDLDVLTEKAATVEQILRSIPGCADASPEQVIGQPVLQIKVRPDQLARYGVPARQVLDLVEALGSRVVGEVVEGQLRFPLVVRLPERLRTDPGAIGRAVVAAPNGEQVPLDRLAEITIIDAPSTITREWGQRRVAVACNIRGRDVGSFVAEAQKRIRAQVPLPKGRYRLEFGGQFEHLIRARQRLMILVPVALFLIFGLLYLTYHRFLDAVRVFTGVPFAAVGGVVALWLRDMPVSISAAVGFIALSGVSVLGDMVLVTTVRQLIEAGLPMRRAVEEAALTRLRPVLMTALVASLGFLPMALSTGMGAEVQRPLATVVIGGVITSTVLTLFVLPVLYTLVGPGKNLTPPPSSPMGKGEKDATNSATFAVREGGQAGVSPRPVSTAS